MNQEFLAIISIITLGYLLKRFNILQEKDGVVLSKLIFKITLPALVLVTFDSVKIEPSLMLLPFMVLLYGLLVVAIGFFVFKQEERELKGSFLMLSSGFNVGLFAFPLILAIWGMEGITYFGMFDVGSSFIVFGVSYIVGSYYSKEGVSLKPLEILKRLGKSIPLMSYIVASGLNFLHIKLPDFFINVATTISMANIPLSLLLLGLYLNFHFEKQFIKPVLKYLTFRYGLGLLFGVALFYLLPHEPMFKYTFLLGVLLPVPTSALTYALEFKYSPTNTRLMGTITNLTILLGIVILFVFSNFIQ